MEASGTIRVLDALAQPTRLDAVELLLQHPDGMPSGDVARALKVPHNTMSQHLTKLNIAGLVRSERRSRRIVYFADREQLVACLLALVDRFRANSKTRARA